MHDIWNTNCYVFTDIPLCCYTSGGRGGSPARRATGIGTSVFQSQKSTGRRSTRRYLKPTGRQRDGLYRRGRSVPRYRRRLMAGGLWDTKGNRSRPAKRDRKDREAAGQDKKGKGRAGRGTVRVSNQEDHSPGFRHRRETALRKGKEYGNGSKYEPYGGPEYHGAV